MSRTLLEERLRRLEEELKIIDVEISEIKLQLAHEISQKGIDSPKARRLRRSLPTAERGPCEFAIRSMTVRSKRK